MPAQHEGQSGRDSSANELHQQRQVAESFGSDAERYDRARPSYPAALVERIVAASPGPGVLDVGCGTGIAARQFQAAGCRVLGVDPDPRMADLARQSGFGVEVARFEAWDPAGRAFDAVIAGQAWHWVDPVAGAAKAAQVLRPGGRLAVFWNAFQLPPRLGEAFAEVYRQVVPGSPYLWAGTILDAYLMMCGTAADGIRRTGAFGDPEQWRFGWDRPYTRGEWLDQVPTFGGHTQLTPAELEDLLAGIGTAIAAAGGSFTMRYTTVAATAARRASPDPPDGATGRHCALSTPRAPAACGQLRSARAPRLAPGSAAAPPRGSAPPGQPRPARWRYQAPHIATGQRDPDEHGYRSSKSA